MTQCSCCEGLFSTVVWDDDGAAFRTASTAGTTPSPTPTRTPQRPRMARATAPSGRASQATRPSRPS
eukprot:6577889-Prymnesium_polylepis.1